MNNFSLEFNKQLELDVLLNGLVEVTDSYVDKFTSENFDEIVIPEGVTKIGGAVFWGCEWLTTLTISDSVTSIGDSAFWNCHSLTDITIPSSVTSIGEYAFAYCDSLSSLMIPNSVRCIGDSAFYKCDGLTNITFEGKTLDEVEAMENYPWDIPPEKISVQVA